MAKNTYKSNNFKKTKKEAKLPKFRLAFYKDRRFHLALGFFLLVASIYLTTAFISYLFTGKADQSVIESIQETGVRASGIDTENWLGLVGAYVSHYFIFVWFGIAAFFIPPLLFILGSKVVFRKEIIDPYKAFKFSFFFAFWISLFLGYVTLETSSATWSFLSGGIGYELALLFNSLIGWGTVLFLIFTLVVFVIYYFNITTVLHLFEKNSGEDHTGVEEDKLMEDVFSSERLEDREEEEPVEDAETWTIKETTSKPKSKETPSLELDLESDFEPEEEEAKPV